MNKPDVNGVLADFDAMTPEATAAELKRLREENAALKQQGPRGERKPLVFKVSQKRAVSVYGLGRWPVTLYAGQWLWLIQHMEKIAEFIERNRSALEWREGE